MDQPAAHKILLVDDEEAITENLSAFLKRSGFQVVIAANGQQALAAIGDESPDIVIMDVLMPEMDGRQALRQLRREENWIPVILLTQIGESTERAMALEEGADDYLNKPFNPHELVARIKAVLRRAKQGQPPLSAAWILTSGKLTLDRRSKKASLDGDPINLTPKAFSLLEYLMTHPGEVVSRERLLDTVWGWDYPIGTRAVDTRIAELRSALGDNASQPIFIETLPVLGYQFIHDVWVGK
ncbi:MAG: response regulator transcription factor [Anaerolineales bacterium]|nr:response regulator transcription factor [Anaerolineales bacterium]